MSPFDATLQRLNQIPKTTNTVDFRIQSYDQMTLVLTGSFDFSYYHEVEVIFSEVSYISLPTEFDYPHFRMATAAERARIGKIVALEEGVDHVFCIEAGTSTSIEKIDFYVVATAIQIREGMVYYYKREPLAPGERIAHWVEHKCSPIT